MSQAVVSAIVHNVQKTGSFSPWYRGEIQEHAVSEEAVTTPAQLEEGRTRSPGSREREEPEAKPQRLELHRKWETGAEGVPH